MLDFIIEHFDDFFTILGKVVFIGSSLVGLTRSTKVGSLWSKVLKVADIVSIYNTPENKDLLKKAKELIKQTNEKIKSK